MKEPLASPDLSDTETTGKRYIDPESTRSFIEALIKLKQESDNDTADTETPCKPNQ